MENEGQGDSPARQPSVSEIRRAASYSLLQDADQKTPVEVYFPADPYAASQQAMVNVMFSHFITVIIIMNFLQIGVECQWPAEDHPKMSPIYTTFDWLFLAAFSAEIALKIYNVGIRAFFRDPNVGAWNILDTALTVMGLCAQILEPIMGGNVNLAPLKIIRSVRLIRILRVLRGVEDLMIAIEGLFSSLSSLFWVVLLMAVTIYTFAIIFSHLVDHTIMDPGYQEAHESGDDAALEEIFAKHKCDQDIYFCNLQASSITLIDMVMGATWAEVIHPIAKHQTWLIPIFVLFLIIASFGLLNVVVGVIVDATTDTKSRISWSKRHQLLCNLSVKWRKHMESRGLGSVRVGLGEMSAHSEEMAQKRKDEILVLLSSIIEQDVANFPAATTAEELMQMLDLDGDSHISQDEFVIGVGRILLGDIGQHNFGQLLNQGKILQMLRMSREQQEELKTQMGSVEGEVREELRMIKEQLARIF